MRLLCPDLSSVLERLIPEASAVREQQMNKKIQANKKINDNINIIYDITNFYETETNNYNKKLSNNNNTFIKTADITETLLSSIATNAT